MSQGATRQPLEAGQAGKPSLLEPLEGSQLWWHLDFSPVREPFQTLDVWNSKDNEFMLFKPQGWWYLCMTAIGE